MPRGKIRTAEAEMPQVGNVVIFKKEITQELIDGFAALIEDFNPMHTKENFPGKEEIKKKLNIGRPIAHGMLCASLVSGPLWRLGGNGAIFGRLEKVRFIKPVQVGDTVTTRLEVLDIKNSKLQIGVRYTNQQGENVIEPTEVTLFVF